jgi:hypothetical protein
MKNSESSNDDTSYYTACDNKFTDNLNKNYKIVINSINIKMIIWFLNVGIRKRSLNANLKL